MTDTEDPLEGADVGETRHVERSKHFHGINFEPRELHGSDRLGDATITNIEIVEGDDGEADDFVVTWEGDMTKTLPRRWDSCREPRTPEEETQARRRKWLRRGIQTISVAVPMAIAVGVSHYLMRGLDLTMNGVDVGAPTAGMALSIFLLGMLMFAIIRWLPGRMNGGRFA
jgi:hypothetical protein